MELLSDRIDVVAKPEGFGDWAGLLALLRESFAYMDNRIDPPSSIHRLDADGLAAKSAQEDLILTFRNGEPVGCLFSVPRGEALYLGKIAVKPRLQGRGITRRMLELAEAGARVRGLKVLELQTRIELTENHRAFAALGFEKVGETCHPEYDRTTSLTFRKILAP